MGDESKREQSVSLEKLNIANENNIDASIEERIEQQEEPPIVDTAAEHVAQESIKNESQISILDSDVNRTNIIDIDVAASTTEQQVIAEENAVETIPEQTEVKEEVHEESTNTTSIVNQDEAPLFTDPAVEMVAENIVNPETVKPMIKFGKKMELDPIYNLYLEESLEYIADFEDRQESFATLHKKYLESHPEIRSFLSDYMQLLLHRKPEDVYKFTTEYFAKKIE